MYLVNQREVIQMRNLLNTPTKALLADVACWTALIGLLICVGVTAENQLLAGVMLTVATLLGLFALVYNGRNIRTVVRSKLANRAWVKEQTLRLEEESRREEARLAERARQSEKDAVLGRAIIDTINRYS